MSRRCLALLLLALALPAARAQADPGRIAVPVGDVAAPRADRQQPRVVAAAQPDGGLTTVAEDGDLRSLRILRVDAAGTVVKRTQVALSVARFEATDVVLRPGGGLLVVGGAYGAGVQIVALAPDGTLDRAYGTGGVATTALFGQCSSRLCNQLAVARDGSVVVSGNANETPTDVALQRLRADGSPDPAFGDGGLLRLPQLPGLGGDVALLRDGRIVVAGANYARTSIQRLLPDGRPDPVWGEGQPVTVEAIAEGIAVTTDDAVWLAGGLSGPEGLLTRFGDDGRPAGSVSINANRDSDLTPEGDGVVVTTIYDLQHVGGNLTAGPLLVPPRPKTASSGIVDGLGVELGTTQDLVLPRIGGGAWTTGVARLAGRFMPGRYGPLVERLAVRAFRSDGSPDRAFGGPATPLGFDVGLPVQRVRTALRREVVRVTIGASDACLVAVRVLAGETVVAQGAVAPATTTRRTADLPVTDAGYALLRRGRPLRATVEASARNLLDAVVRARGTGRLR